MVMVVEQDADHAGVRLVQVATSAHPAHERNGGANAGVFAQQHPMARAIAYEAFIAQQQRDYEDLAAMRATDHLDPVAALTTVSFLCCSLHSLAEAAASSSRITPPMARWVG